MYVNLGKTAYGEGKIAGLSIDFAKIAIGDPKQNKT